MNMWRAMGPELTVGVFLLVMVGGMLLTFFLSR
jgi:hypothetical protein